ncbi:hypothetical protein [Burkholderia pyrrocinia]|uniref:hypothetical protein n=1 Tax=Burkholderia pyrrocinia TaxID=60550 RepID=UPI001BD0F91E|nr:hypothetical protein [Burkholderia pyrrocinia]QVN20017.1 hypothetical protein JYG32_25755 [Burkholderia pyrrocinia]
MKYPTIYNRDLVQHNIDSWPESVLLRRQHEPTQMRIAPDRCLLRNDGIEMLAAKALRRDVRLRGKSDAVDAESKGDGK